MPAKAPVRLSQQTSPLVVPQRLPIHSGRGGHITASQAGGHLVAIRAAARCAKASRTSMRSRGTLTASCKASPSEVKVKVKKEQHCVSRAVRSRTLA
jgi:hypothetical protein